MLDSITGDKMRIAVATEVIIKQNLIGRFNKGLVAHRDCVTGPLLFLPTFMRCNCEFLK